MKNSSDYERKEFNCVWFAEDGEVYISFEVGAGENRHIESHPLNSAAAEGFIRRYLRNRDEKSPRKNDVEDFRSDLLSLCYEKGVRLTTHLRTGEYQGKMYFDLGGSDWKCVEITPEGWQIIPLAPIAFRRNAHMYSLPTPERGGSLELLKELIHFPSETDFLMFCSFLINAFHPTGPYFHLMLIGEKGSAKSTVARHVQNLLHPSSSSLKGLPKNEQDFVIEAFHNRLVMIDNENDLGTWLPNALCRLSTGTGTSTRTLYTNRDQMAFKVSRPAILTAHKVPTQQSDLIERSMIVNLERPAQYVTEKKLAKRFDQIGGKILGAIFDAISASLARRESLPEEKLRLHRMSDASYFIACTAENIGWRSPDHFLSALKDNQEVSITRGKPDDSLLILSLVQEMVDKEIWEETPNSMLDSLRNKSSTPDKFPKTATMFSRRLNALQEFLLPYGLLVESGIMATGGKSRLIRIHKDKNIYRPPFDLNQNDNGHITP